MRYVLQGDHLLFRHEDDSQDAKLIGYIFTPEDAVILTAMLNASVALADAVLTDDDGPARRRQVHVTVEDMEKLAGMAEPLKIIHPVVIEEATPFYSWDGETEHRYLHRNCDAAILEGREDGACRGCRGETDA